MKNSFVCCVFLFCSTLLFGQKKGFDDLDEALKDPESVESLYLLNQTKYSYSEELPAKLAQCKNLRKIYFGWHKKLDLPKLFHLLAQLPHLDTLQFYACSIQKIPKEIGLLKELDNLNLELNDIVSIAPEIGELKQLTYLNLNSNKLSLLPDEIGQLTRLEELHVVSNTLYKLPNTICELQQLKKLALTYNRLQFLPDNIHSMKALRSLYLGENRFQSLPESIALVPLEEFSIGGFQNEWKQFPLQVFQMTTLKKLSIYDCRLSQLPAEMVNMLQLENLYLRNLESLNWQGAFNHLANLPALRNLEIVFERFGTLPSEIAGLKQITKLKLVGSVDSYAIMKNVAILQQLKSLQFESYNDTILPPEIGNLSQLEFLEFKSSRLEKLPPEIGRLKQLKELGVSANWGQSIELPKEIGHLINLKKLDISWSNVKVLPDEIGELEQLEELSIWGGDLKVLPASIGKLQQLRELTVHGNYLEQLPKELFQLEGLHYLDLSANNLKELSSDVAKLINLENLDLSENIQLKNLPENLETLKKMQNLFLQVTQVTELPVALEELPELKRISLCDNLIEHPDQLKKRFNDILEMEGSCRELEKLFVNFEEKYGGESAKFGVEDDSLVFTYYYTYNEPHVIDEEYFKSISFKLPRHLAASKKTFEIPDQEIMAKAIFFNIWTFEVNYTELKGHLEILELDKKQAKVAVTLSGKFQNREEREVLLDKTLVYTK